MENYSITDFSVLAIPENSLRISDVQIVERTVFKEDGSILLSNVVPFMWISEDPSDFSVSGKIKYYDRDRKNKNKFSKRKNKKCKMKKRK